MYFTNVYIKIHSKYTQNTVQILYASTHILIDFVIYLSVAVTILLFVTDLTFRRPHDDYST